MKLINVELPVETARELLRVQEAKVQAKQAQRVILDGEITELDASIQSLRKQLNGEADIGSRAPRGSNKEKIVAFLKTVPHAKPTDIFKATKVAKSSVPYILKHNPSTFEYIERKGWKLKQ